MSDASFQNNVPDPLQSEEELPGDLSAWIAGNRVDVLATNFGKPASLFEKFPRKDVFIVPNQ